MYRVKLSRQIHLYTFHTDAIATKETLNSVIAELEKELEAEIAEESLGMFANTVFDKGFKVYVSNIDAGIPKFPSILSSQNLQNSVAF